MILTEDTTGPNSTRLPGLVREAVRNSQEPPDGGLRARSTPCRPLDRCATSTTAGFNFPVPVLAGADRRFRAASTVKRERALLCRLHGSGRLSWRGLILSAKRSGTAGRACLGQKPGVGSTPSALANFGCGRGLCKSAHNGERHPESPHARGL